MNKIYMLDTNICSFIMREQPEALLKHLEQSVLRGHRIVVSAITYSEMRFGATGPKASPRHVQLVDAFQHCCVRGSMPSCRGTAPRWMRPRRLRWHCVSPARRSVRTTRR
ncbi:hypothetical protein EIMP300_01060 [Escherichia coli]|uniref:Uncharacterized protein n=1 Tax=Escherichia coli TaxID=562 RepID=A0A8S0FFM4_ECOLX|nr:hypothetical protein EIMP300_01060 [Escherichia coli]